MNNTLRNILHIIILISIQVFLLNNINLNNWVNPFICTYILFLFPYQFSRMGMLFIAFGTGVVIDLFSSSYGLNTIALTAVGFIRPFLLGALVPDMKSDEPTAPHILQIGVRRFLSFLFLIVLIHQFVLYFAESFTLSGFFYTLLKITLGTVSSALIIFVYELIFFFRR